MATDDEQTGPGEDAPGSADVTDVSAPDEQVPLLERDDDPLPEVGDGLPPTPAAASAPPPEDVTNEAASGSLEELFPGIADDALVVLDRLGSVQPGAALRGVIIAPQMPEATRRRLDGIGEFDVTEDLARAAEASLVLLSTRLPRAELTALLGQLATAATCPIVALVHTGGESLGLEVMRHGGTGIVAEGNESALVAFLDSGASSDVLLDSYDRHVARSEQGPSHGLGRDVVTGLPDRSSMEMRLATLEQEGEVPRVAFIRVTRTPQVPEQLGEEAANQVGRRMAIQFLHVARAYDCELFALGRWEYGLVGVTLSPNAAQYVGRDLDHIAETYAPAGIMTLSIAMGHAGSEVSTDLSGLREAALRALDAAASDRSAVVVGADTLSLGVSATTELEAAMRVVAFVEKQNRFPVGHGERVGEFAAAIATELGYEGLSRSRIQLAGHLHHVGLASLPPDAITDPGGLTGELLQAFRNHPVTAARYLVASAGSEAAATVRGYRERWDGTGYPDGLAGADIPLGARIVAVAHALEELVHGPAGSTGQQRRYDEVLTALRDRAGSELDPDIVDVAVDLLDALWESVSALRLAG